MSVSKKWLQKWKDNKDELLYRDEYTQWTPVSEPATQGGLQTG